MKVHILATLSAFLRYSVGLFTGNYELAKLHYIRINEAWPWPATRGRPTRIHNSGPLELPVSCRSAPVVCRSLQAVAVLFRLLSSPPPGQAQMQNLQRRVRP